MLNKSILLLFLCSGCLTRNQINSAVWLNNGMNYEICGVSKAESKNPELWDYGFYRKLNDGTFEFMPYCNPIARDYISMTKEDFKKILDSTIPRGKRP